MPRRDYLLMERYAAESMQADREQAVISALKSKTTPWPEIAVDFGMSEKELIEIAMKAGLAGPKQKKPDDIVDARDEKRGGTHGR